MTGITPVPFIGRKLRRFGLMPGQNVVLAGEKTASEALEAALREQGLDAHRHDADGLVNALVSLERQIEEDRPRAAVAVGTGEAALALAITASKMGVPLASVPGTVPGTGNEAAGAGDQGRILATLASLDAGSDPARAANLIDSWLSENPPASDLH
jgi:hypothetical protein